MVFQAEGISRQMRNAPFAHEIFTTCRQRKRKSFVTLCATLARLW